MPAGAAPSPVLLWAPPCLTGSQRLGLCLPKGGSQRGRTKARSRGRLLVSGTQPWGGAGVEVSGPTAWRGGVLGLCWFSLTLMNCVPEDSVSLAWGLTVVRSPCQCRYREPLTWPMCRGPAGGPSHRCLPLGSAPFTLLPRGTRAAGPWAGQEPRGGTASSVPSSGPVPATGTPPLPGLGRRGLQSLCHAPLGAKEAGLGGAGAPPGCSGRDGPACGQVPHPGSV